MNETPNDPQKLEDIDPTVLAEIEAEFAAIANEIQRISTLPANLAPKKPAMLTALRAEWQQKAEARDPNRPEWRKSLDAALDRAIDKLVADSLVELPDGQLAFEMNNQALQSEAPPIMKALLAGVTAMLQDKLKPAPGATPSPWSPLLQSFAGMMGQALSKIELGPVKAPVPPATEAPLTPGDAATPKPKDPDAPLGGEGIQLRVNVPLDAKIAVAHKSEATDEATQPSQAGQEFFANLMQGLGHFLQSSFKTSAPQAEPPRSDAAEAAPEAAQADAPEPTKVELPTVATVELKQEGAPQDGPQPTVKIDVQGLLKQLLSGLTKPPPK